MSIYSNSVKNPITTIMIFVGLMVFGIYSLTKVPVDLMPKIETPVLSVITFYQGANATDIEENVTKVLENQLNALQGLKKLTSSSKDNVSFIQIEFEYGTNIDESSNQVRDAISMVDRMLPDGCEKPLIFKFSSDMIPVIIYGVQAKESYPALQKILDERLVQKLSRIDGVGTVSIVGAPVRAVQVKCDPRKLDAYNLSIEQIGNAIRAENIALPSGNIETGVIDYSVRVNGEFTTSDIVKDIIIANTNGKEIRIKDVAEVTDTLKKLTVDERVNSERGVRIIIQKQSGANTVKVAKKVKEKLNEIQKDFPSDVKLIELLDTSTFINNSINSLLETLFEALIFVILVVLVFLTQWRPSFIVLLTIPISLITSFIYLYLSDNSINIISLSALAIAIGMVVDDAIVVLENITKHIERGSSPHEAAIFATNEISLAVVASTLTIVAVFLPLTMITGLTGVFFRQLGWIVSITIVVSLVAAITIIPMLSSQLLKPIHQQKKSNKIVQAIQNFWNKIDNLYVRSLKYFLKHKTLTVIGAAGIFIGSLILMKWVGTEFMPASDNGRINVSIELPQGIRLSETRKIADSLEHIFKVKYPEIIGNATSIGAGEGANLITAMTKSASYIINFTIVLPELSKRQRTIFEIGEEMRKDISQFTEVASFFVDPGASRNMSSQMMGGGGGSNIEVKVFGYNFDETNKISDILLQYMKNQQGFKDVTVSRDKDKAEIQIIPNRLKLSQLGIPTATLASAVRNRILGMTASKYKEDGTEYDIIIKYDDAFLTSIQDLENLSIQGPRGNTVKLKDVAEIKQLFTTPNIEHENKVRVNKIVATLDGVDLGTATSIINKKINSIDIPKDTFVEIGGAAKDMQDSFKDIALLFVLIILLVYIVMAAQFESLREPFIIMFSVPFAITGVVISLLITGATLNLISGIAIVMLVGIVVKNSIVLIDFTNILRKRGQSISKAIIEAGRSRLRPILMTSLTTILGMVPLAISSGDGATLWRPMGIAMIGGLTFSLIISLILVPVIYSMFGKSAIKKIRRTISKNN